MKKYLVEVSKTRLSLMTEQEIRSLMQNSRHLPVRIFSDEKNEWMSFQQFTLMSTEKREWYYYGLNGSVGVFNHLEMIKLVQSKKIAPTQMIWKPGMKAWIEFCRAPEFSNANLKSLVRDFPSLIETVFSKRKSPRVQFHADFLLQHHDKIWKAESFEIGTGGVGLQVKGTGLKIGESVEVHLLSNTKTNSFKAKAQIVSHLKDTSGMKPDRFGLQFIEVTSGGELALQRLLGAKLD